MLMNLKKTLFFASLLVLFAFSNLGLCESPEKGSIKNKGTDSLGGLQGPGSDSEIESIGRFAVQDSNEKENAYLEFVRVIKAKEQVVAGKIYHLTLEAINGGKKEVYEAKVWVKPWMNFKQLQEFKHARDVPLVTS